MEATLNWSSDLVFSPPVWLHGKLWKLLKFDCPRLARVNSLSPLVEAGILQEGEVLTMRRRGANDVKAQVGASGELILDGKKFRTPSGAAKSVVNRPINGWSAWRNSSGSTLLHLRDSLSK